MYHYPGIELLLKVVPVDNIVFGSEMVGAVGGIDPETGHYFDDTKRYIDQVPSLSAADKKKIFELNMRKVYPRISPLSTAQFPRLNRPSKGRGDIRRWRRHTHWVYKTAVMTHRPRRSGTVTSIGLPVRRCGLRRRRADSR